ncbi:MAG: hypothetical protein SGI88_18865 [Candidatus Hydrogenedentes bacterium]|nr:hypothetical protein [Candidatus Hydrogenedentota bacterium]
MPKFNSDLVSPAGVPLRQCTQAERHEWIRTLADVDIVDAATLMARREWFRGYEVHPLDDFTPGLGAGTAYRLQYRDRPDAPEFWCVLERCRSYDAVVEMGFIVACTMRKTRRK